MQGNTRLTEAEIDTIVKDYRAGDPIREIAAHFGVSELAICKALQLRAVTMRVGDASPALGGRGYRYS